MLIENKDRKIGLYILKFIVAFLVTCIHATFEGEFGKYDIWQYTSSGSIPGIIGNVDLDWCFARYC